MLKLVFVDMDGTFLDSHKAVDEKNELALAAADELGVQFVPCTGRNVNGVPAQMVAHDCVRYAVCCNGALVCDANTMETLHEVCLDKAVVADLFAQVKDLSVTFDVFADGKVYTFDDRWHYLDEMNIDEPTRVQIKDVRERYHGSFEELLSSCGSVCRINVFFLDEASKQQVWDVVDANPGLRRTSSLPTNIEITHTDAHKGAGLAWLCDYLGVDMADTVAFGDSENDLTMLAAAGDGVAMANSLPCALEAADHVTKSCDESGVAAYLEPLFLDLRNNQRKAR